RPSSAGRAGHRLKARFASGADRRLTGSLVNEAGGVEELDQMVWKQRSRLLFFRRVGAGFWQHYRVQVEPARFRLQGVFSHQGWPGPPPPGAYLFEIRGEKRAAQREVAPGDGGKDAPAAEEGADSPLCGEGLDCLGPAWKAICRKVLPRATA